MGAVKNAAQDKKDARRAAGRRVQRDVEAADWGSADAALVQELVVAVTTQGGAVRFGYTSDGGAYAVGFYGDGDPYTEYVRPSEDITYMLKTWIEAWR